MAKLKDITGQQFGRLTVVRYAGASKWECVCECGTVRVVEGGNLKSGRTRGCWKHYPKRPRKIPSNAGHPLYSVWRSMHRRCRDKGDPLYGGRGIRVCESWGRFKNFLADMGERPPGSSLDRYPDKNGDYAPGNVRWATPTEQANNTRSNRILWAFGKSMTMAEWSREVGLSQDVIEQRIRTLRWPTEKALATPKRHHSFNKG